MGPDDDWIMICHQVVWGPVGLGTQQTGSVWGPVGLSTQQTGSVWGPVGLGTQQTGLVWGPVGIRGAIIMTTDARGNYRRANYPEICIW